MKVQKYAKVRLSIEVLWIERDYFVQKRNGRLWLLLLQGLLNLRFKLSNLRRNIRCGLCR